MLQSIFLRALTRGATLSLLLSSGCLSEPIDPGEPTTTAVDSSTRDRSAVDAMWDTGVEASPAADDAAVDAAVDAASDGAAESAADVAPADAGTEGGQGPVLVDVEGGGDVVSISVSAPALTPPFSASIEDYYVRCAAGTNELTVAVSTTGGSGSFDVSLVESQAVVVQGRYWIRCLPHDFPTITVTTNPEAGAPTPGWYLVNGTAFAVVMDTNGTPVWYSRASNPGNVDALLPGTISFCHSPTSGAFGTSTQEAFSIVDLGESSTTTLTAVGSPTDLHELRLLPNGDHLLFTYLIETGFDLTGLQSFGANETIADPEVQEIDPTGNLVWSWRASDHVDIVNESLEPAVQTVSGASVVDPFHFNSIEVDSMGNLLLSARHTNSLFYVNRTTGDVLWKLGGTSYNKDGAVYIEVVDDPMGAFNMQHDARLLPNGDITLFDDHGATASGLARGVEYAVDFESGTATPVFQFLGTGRAGYEGSFRRYADGESVIGWGFVSGDPRVVTEIDSDGEDVLDIAFSPGQPSYRAIKVPLSQLDVQALRGAVSP